MYIIYYRSYFTLGYHIAQWNSPVMMRHHVDFVQYWRVPNAPGDWNADY